MRFHSIGGSDARLIAFDIMSDERGHFARTWCADLFSGQGIHFNPVQANTSFTKLAGTVRGMHFQRAPKADAKLVRCTAGRIHDVIVDLREGSPTRGEAYALELDQNVMLYAPAGFAHGFQTLTPEVAVEYMMGIEYVPELYGGFRHNDPLLCIDWPLPVTALSHNDANWPPLSQQLPWLRP